MPYGAVTLTPGLNVERTPTLLRTGFAQTQFVRFRDSLVQKLGGWLKYYPFAVGGIPRDLHAWQDLNDNLYLSIGTTSQLAVISNNSLQDISPQVLTSNFIPNISTTASSNIVSITDPNIANVTTNDSVQFNTPISVGGIVLSGLYPIFQVTGTDSYEIQAQSNATVTQTNPQTTSAPTAVSNDILHFSSVPSWVVNGIVINDLTTPTAIPASTIATAETTNTVTMNNAATGAGVGSGDSIVFASLPVFVTTSGSSIITVTLLNHGQSVDNFVDFPIPTTGGGVTISGSYEVLSVIDSNNFTIAASTIATGNVTFVMNGGLAQIVYQIALGPPAAGSGYGLGGYGSGGYGTGTTGGQQTGTDIAASSWTTGNWGQILLACPKGGGIYYWQPGSGFQTASIIPEAPPFNQGIFISNVEQIAIAYGSSVLVGIGYQSQPLLVQWSDVGNFFQWTANATTQAGNFTLSSGSLIIGGLAVANQNLIWTDEDLWAMNYIGPPDVFGFTKVGAGMGLASAHAIQQLRGAIFWMGPSNFFVYSGGSPNVIPCPVWDAVFQNLNTNFLQNICALPNTPFNEIGWCYPSSASVTGECDSYVKMNILEPGAPWDYGLLNRSAWIDVSVLGMPIGTSSGGLVYQHEVSNDADGQPLVWSFTTGFFYLAEGEQFAYVDQILPDFKWNTFPQTATPAQIQLTFNVVNFPGDTPVQYGPYTVTQQTEYLNVRFRGRLMSITCGGSDLGSFARLGSCKYRYNPVGRR